MLRKVGFACVMALMLCAIAWPQEPRPKGNSTVPQNANPQAAAPQNQPGTPRIAPGSVIPVELTKGIDAKKVKTGDPVEAKVTMDLKTNSGEVLVPKDTKVMGHVTEAQPRSKEQKESQVGIAFDHAVMKSGSNMQLPLSIQAVISPSAMNGGGNNNALTKDQARPLRNRAVVECHQLPETEVAWVPDHHLRKPPVRTLPPIHLRKRAEMLMNRLPGKPKESWVFPT